MSKDAARPEGVLAGKKTRSKTDKRRAAWTLSEDTRRDIAECFRSTAVLVGALDSNTNTWGKIDRGDLVKRESAKALAEGFLSFLEGYENGDLPPDASKYHDRHVKTAIEKYLKGASGATGYLQMIIAHEAAAPTAES